MNITISPGKSRELLEKIGICFLFAQNSLSAPTKVCEVKDGTFTSYEITPELRPKMRRLRGISCPGKAVRSAMPCC